MLDGYALESRVARVHRADTRSEDRGSAFCAARQVRFHCFSGDNIVRALALTEPAFSWFIHS